MNIRFLLPFVMIVFLGACVSKKKYTELETKYTDTKGNLQKLQMKFDKINQRIDSYNAKINTLQGDNQALENDNKILERENALKLDMIEGKAVLSKEARALMNATLQNVAPEKLASAKNLKDSLDLAISYNIVSKALGASEFNSSEDIDVGVDDTVVMISVSDKLLFNSGSYRFKNSGMQLLKKLADIIQSEPSLDVMIEGHTDSKTIQNEVLQDNWDLSVKRATSIVRILEKEFNIEGSRLIAAGRGDTMPLFPNTNDENRAKNRRIKIILLPNLNKFFALLKDDGVID